MRHRPRLLFVVILCGLCACGGRDTQTEDAPRPAVEVSDSAGVKNVFLGRVEELSAPDLVPDLVFSTMELGVELFWVGEVIFLGNGGLAVANTGATEVVLLSADGSVTARVGGPGEGPGEFSAITTLLATDAGFLAYDARLARVTEFSENGEILASSRLSTQSAIVDLELLAMGAAGHMLAILGEQRFFLPEGMTRDTTPLLLFTDLETEPDTLGLLPAKEWSYGGMPGGGFTRHETGFGRDIVAQGLMDRALIGDTDVFSLSIYKADGTLTRRIRGSDGGWAVTPEEIRAWRAERLDRREPDAPDWYVEFVENAPYRETHPAFHAAVLGPDEMVWIGLATRPGEETRRWLVIGPDGQPRGQVDLPAEASVLAVDVDRFALLQRSTAFDEEEVRLYRYAQSR